MVRGTADYSWLPEHQEHVVFTVGHIDDLIATAADILFDYVRPPGPLELENMARGALAHVTVVAVAPLPSAVARYAGDALTQMRAAIEHTLYVEVEHQLGRRLTDREARSIEMPACSSEPEFTAWLKGNKRSTLAPLTEGAPLVGRLRDLQPYQRRDTDVHPLRVLVDHTNVAKHRAPAVAATLLGAVTPDVWSPNLVLATGDDRPIRAGDILASGPLHERIPLSIWPKVSMQRPHTKTWHVVLKELGYLERWVRTVAIPHLIAGTHQVDPLPTQVDTRRGYNGVQDALEEAGSIPAVTRATSRIQAGMVREGLAETLALHPSHPDVRVIRAWVDTLNDQELLERQDRLEVIASVADYVGVDRVVRELLVEASESVHEQRTL